MREGAASAPIRIPTGFARAAMNDREFGKRLAQELPRWQKEGWVSVEGGQAILDE